MNSINYEQFLDLIVYQIYPRSFKDSNNDGIGDINGILEKLDYIEALGVNAIWICPCYKSPNYDNGYDISDYRDIMDELGTLDDWKKLKNELEKKKIKLIMDLVVNHTSSHHKWFQQGRMSKDNPYHDYYIWADKPKNNWGSMFGGSAWEYNEPTNEYYLHSFAIQQPDLNWENPAVRKECCDIVDFWVDLGVDGFRCDVIDYISKDFENNKISNGPLLHEYIRELFGRDKVSHIFTIGESQATKQNILDICGKDRRELKTVFQFEHIHLGRKDKYTPGPFSYDDLKNVLISWQKFSQENDFLYTLFTDNHDQPYYLSRLGNDKELRYECATMFATMIYLLRGIPIIYQTQEYGATNSYYDDITEFNDIETINYYNAHKIEMASNLLMEKVNYGSRDNTRRPMAWNKDKENYYGFSSSTPWVPVNSRAEEINVETDLSKTKSILKFYQNLLAYRKNKEVIKKGTFEDLTGEQKGCFVYKRSLFDKDVIVICNFDKAQKIVLPEAIKNGGYKAVITNYPSETVLKGKFKPYEVIVYEKFGGE